MRLTVLTLTFHWYCIALSAAIPPPEFDPNGSQFLRNYCIDCHGQKEPEADLILSTFSDSGSLIQERKTWKKIIEVVNSGQMPPKDEKKRPSVAEVESFLALVNHIFDYHDRNAKPDPGRVTMRRLNRAEYRNTIRDLVGIDFDPTEDFPSDDIGHGFDNIGDVLTVSPLLMERYLGAAETIMEQALPKDPPAIPIRRLTSNFAEPASAESIHMSVNGFRPMRTDGQRKIDIGPVNRPYEWKADSEYIFRTRVYREGPENHPLQVTILVHGKGIPNPTPKTELEHLLGGIRKPARILKTFQVNAVSPKEAETLEVRVPPMPGRHRMLIAINKPTDNTPPATLWIEYLELEGPLDIQRPHNYFRLLGTQRKNPQFGNTQNSMAPFLRRAFRRPPTKAELNRSIDFVDRVVATGESWEMGIRFAMTAALSSPKFLFRMETDENPKAKNPRFLNEFQLASRLSYFLWSTMPDDELLVLAEKGQLSQQLNPQIIRMLADERAYALVENFATQWLQLKRIAFISPDGKRFPTFNNDLRNAMLQETELFFESIIRNDSSILDLINANYSFINKSLAQHYGIQPKKGQKFHKRQFQKVVFDNENRGGLLTHASVLTVTSNPTRTSPVKRGRWVLEQLLGAPPPPPPADVPELPESEKIISAATFRKKLEIHRSHAECANCHAKMDPIGFSLENFNAIGAWRTDDDGITIDSSGEFSDGTKIKGVSGLKGILMKQKEDFLRCLVEKMMTYALGRGIEYYDRPVIDKIVQSLPKRDYKFSALVQGIVNSDAFLQRRGE